MVSKKKYDSVDGVTSRFLSDFIIQSEQFARVYNYFYNPAGVEGEIDPGTGLPTRVLDQPDPAEDLVTLDKWDLVDNSILFYTEPVATSSVWIEVATTPEEFGETLVAPSVERSETAADEAEASAAAALVSETNAAASEANIDPTNILHTVGYGGIDPVGYTTSEVDTNIIDSINIIDVDVISNLSSIDTLKYTSVNVRGYSTVNDGGGGRFNYDASQSAVNNGGTIINGWVRQYEGAVNVKWFGASDTKTDAQNKTIIEAALQNIDDLDFYIPSDLDYGYIRNDGTTYIDFTGVTTNKIVTDHSHDNENDLNPPSRGGAQERRFMFTPDEQNGLHNAFYYLHSRWHTGFSINHNGGDEMLVANGGAGKNRRASVFFGQEDNANWRIGQGSTTNDTYTDMQLSDFLIACNGIGGTGGADEISPGTTGLTTMFNIQKTTGNIGFSTPTPVYGFDYRSRASIGGNPNVGFTGNNIKIFLENDLTSKIMTLQPYSLGGMQMTDGTNTLLTMETAGLLSIRRPTEGNVAFDLSNTNSGKLRSFRFDTADNIRITNVGATSNTFTHDNAGNLTITGVYAPFTGVHFFKSDTPIDVGMAVELQNVSEETHGGYRTNGTVIVSSNQSKTCVGTVERTVEVDGVYIIVVAAVGDNRTNGLNGFKVCDENGAITAGDILCCASKAGYLMKIPVGLGEEVVRFKAMETAIFDVSGNAEIYGYFK